MSIPDLRTSRAEVAAARFLIGRCLARGFLTGDFTLVVRRGGVTLAMHRWLIDRGMAPGVMSDTDEPLWTIVHLGDALRAVEAVPINPDLKAALARLTATGAETARAA